MKKIIVSLILVLFLVELAHAENSASIAVSCTIPAIPGVNVPLIQEKTPNLELNTAQEEIADTNTAVVFQKDTEEIRLAEGEKSLVNVQTFYNR